VTLIGIKASPGIGLAEGKLLMDYSRDVPAPISNGLSGLAWQTKH
jgi:hypothetical protein